MNALVVLVQHETRCGDMDYGSENWKLAPLLERVGTDVVVRKTASDAFLDTNLQELLVSRGIESYGPRARAVPAAGIRIES